MIRETGKKVESKLFECENSNEIKSDDQLKLIVVKMVVERWTNDDGIKNWQMVNFSIHRCEFSLLLNPLINEETKKKV